MAFPTLCEGPSWWEPAEPGHFPDNGIVSWIVGESLSGVGVVDKAVLLIDVVEAGPCSLGDLIERTGLPRATAHRLATALEVHGLLGRDQSGCFVLGPRLAELSRAAAARLQPALAELAAPVLAGLRDATGESAQLYVRSGATRVCIASLESPHSLRTIVSVGAVLPLDLGSAGKVLSGRPGAAPQGWAESVEERELGVTSVSAPVVVAGETIAAVSVSGPVGRTSRSPAQKYAPAVIAAARALEAAIARLS
jgi:DNA-binding IclR family transcriptional regulator